MRMAQIRGKKIYSKKITFTEQQTGIQSPLRITHEITKLEI